MDLFSQYMVQIAEQPPVDIIDVLAAPQELAAPEVSVVKPPVLDDNNDEPSTLDDVPEPTDKDLAQEELELEEEQPVPDNLYDDLAAIEAHEPLDLYNKEIHRVPLLKAEEEVDLARRIERGRFAGEELAREEATTKRTQELHTRVEDGLRAREHLIRANTRLVVRIANQYKGRGVPLLDLIQEGNIGLIRSVYKFDYHRGKFANYASWWIRQTINRAIHEQGRAIRVPGTIEDKYRQLPLIQHEFNQRLKRDPSVEELAVTLNESPVIVEFMLQMSYPLPSMDQTVDEAEALVLGDTIEDQDTPLTDDAAARLLLQECINKASKNLSPREKYILQLRYGLVDGINRTLEEVGPMIGGVTRERVRQLETRALRKLHIPKLEEYL